ncbi:MmgE/PrpD family protein [Rhodoferax sediminis]|uniref:MmgE/PrpD family protein n=1 Tax=Rhodoferax sediminis TaxID=2509614 RepID=A0A515DDX1_9BURK|nr:MmgE/PrpD family protein [Rhodoferax sediminis]QDL38611.1 MmgE/PrpD family protein [Rhodoferax sediminis]
MPTSTDLSSDFAHFAAETRYEDLPAAAVEGAKKSILDTLGVILAASGVEPAVHGVAELVREGGGRAESSVLGFGGKVPAVMAAFANGAMAHCLDFDDHAPEGHHPSSSIVPAALAVAERRGGVSGRNLIAAVAAGQDMFLRLRRNVSWKQDWHLTTVLGVFSAAASACRVLGLDADRTLNALGIASMQSCGTMELAYGVGSDLRGMYAGFSTKGAVLAALLAEKGTTGIRSVFEGKAGIFNVYFEGKYDRAKMLRGLGTDYDGGSILFKPWPSCGASHGFIHATLGLMGEHKLALSDIAEIRVNVGDFQQQLCEPIASRRRPATPADAKFSIPFCVAVAATRGAVKVSDFFGANLQDPQVLAAAEKVVPVVDRGFDWKGHLPKGRLDIVTRDGRTLSRVGDNVPGDAECPMDWDYLFDKFRDCASLAAVAPSAAKIRQAQEMARHLEALDDATELLRVLG